MGDSIKPKAQLQRNNELMPHSWAMSKKDSARYDLIGQATGAHDALYKPEEQPAIPYTDPMASAATARDRTRRMARMAQGLVSTIHAGSLATPYSAGGKQLVGT